jgi:hypothetical protein
VSSSNKMFIFLKESRLEDRVPVPYVVRGDNDVDNIVWN